MHGYRLWRPGLSSKLSAKFRKNYGGSSKKDKKQKTQKKQKGGARGERAGGMEVAVAPLPTEAERRLLQELTESGVRSSQAKIKVTSQ